MFKLLISFSAGIKITLRLFNFLPSGGVMETMGLFSAKKLKPEDNQASLKFTIISLGEVVRPNHLRALPTFAKDIFGEASKENMEKCGKILGIKKDLLDSFKLGTATEEKFIEGMLEAIANTENAQRITKEQFLDAWKLTQPVYEEFKENLNKAIDWAKNKNNQLVFMSATNSLDMKALQKQLEIGKIDVKIGTEGEGDIIEIDGIKLLKTNTEKKDKATLIINALLDAPVNAEIGVIIGKNENVIDCLRKEYDRFTEVMTESSKENSIKIIEFSPQESLMDCLEHKIKPSAMFTSKL